MFVQYRKTSQNTLLRDLWIIFWVQLLSFLLGILFLVLFAVDGIIPDYPDWDNLHLLCGAAGMMFLVVFFIFMLWGGCKTMDVRFTGLDVKIEPYGGSPVSPSRTKLPVLCGFASRRNRQPWSCGSVFSRHHSIPRIFQFYGVSVWTLPLLFFVMSCFWNPTPDSWAEKIAVSFFIGFPVYSIVFLFWICRWLGKNGKRFPPRLYRTRYEE